MKRAVIPALTQSANLKRRIRRHLSELGFLRGRDGSLVLPGKGKSIIRELHKVQRVERIQKSSGFIHDCLPNLLKYFADGAQVDPGSIRPSLERVYGNSWQADLFRMASLTWSVPVSNGFGRRMRYLVWDDHIGKLIGIIAVGDPVFNLSVRDSEIGWNSQDRSARLVNLLDAYVLGSIPPYNSLLCGKLVACLLRTRQIYEDFSASYGNTTGIISGERKRARLLAITTSSSMGRSSVYNRLKLGGIEYLRPVGFSGGWGHFHIPDRLFSMLRDYLRNIDHSYADQHQFGQGPNWRLRTTRAALQALGFDQDLLKHGIQRQVFLCELASNSLKLLRGGRGSPQLDSLLSTAEVARLARDRWVIPRSIRQPEYLAWKSEKIHQLILQGNIPGSGKFQRHSSIPRIKT